MRNNLEPKKRPFLKVLKGLFGIPYEDRLKLDLWKDYFGKYQPQKYGLWDSDSCWALSGVNCVEDQLEFLWKNGQFSNEAKNFFQVNGYIDSDGDFSLSERFIEILSGVQDGGNSIESFWELIEANGIIPRSMLNYSADEANRFASQQAFDNDYFNPNKVSLIMRDLGRQFLKYVDIRHQRIGRLWYTPSLAELRTALFQAPVQIGVPAEFSTWNSTKVNWPGTYAMNHAVELYAVNSPNDPLYDPKEAPYPYFVFDQYHPELKQLSKDYYIPSVMQGVVTVKNVPLITPFEEQTFWQRFWAWESKYFRREASQAGTT